MKTAIRNLVAAALCCAGLVPAQAVRPDPTADHEQAVRVYVDAERALRRALRESTGSQPATAAQRAEVESLARARDTAERRVHESALVSGLPVPDLGAELARPEPRSGPDEPFPRARQLESALRARDVRRLVVRVHLGREV